MRASDWATVLLGALADAGVTDVVISPGSRSTPFVLAAAADPRLRCHDIIDERSAGFFALGQAKVTGRPTVLLCTSGTAAAHYLPAVIEASLSYTPLLALTADRPFELQACGAPQTIDQVKLYGDFVRLALDLGVPDDDEAALRGLARAATQAVFAARSPIPGPVHLNARARKPLEPERFARREVTPARAPAVPSRRIADPSTLDDLARRLRKATRGLIVCGPAPIGTRPAADALAALTGFPLLPEATSQLRFAPRGRVAPCDAFGTILGSPAFRAASAPDLIVQLGATPTSTSWERYLADHPGAERIVIAEHGWPDPQGTATIVSADICATVAALTERRLDRREPTAWQERFARANSAAWRVIDEVLAAHFTDGSVVRTTHRELVPGALLAVGNSLPVRLLDACCPATGDHPVWSQRGASGIDGLISGAAGAADAWPGATVLLLGDISFLHDVGGLFAARRAARPLVLVAIHNDGGRIFDQLPLARTPGLTPAAKDHFTTAHGLSLEPAARLYGVAYQPVESERELALALRTAQGTNGCTVIEARVPPDGARAQAERIRARLEALLP